MSDVANAMSSILAGTYNHRTSIQRRIEFFDFILPRVSKKRFLTEDLIIRLWTHLVHPDPESGILVLEEERDMILGIKLCFMNSNTC
jgi:hypothetical protein